MNYFIIGDDDSVLGFELAGVAGIAVETAEEADKAFSTALEDRNNGIIIMKTVRRNSSAARGPSV